MKIYYDYQIFFHQKFGRISKYFINLVNNLDNKTEKLIIAPFQKTIEEISVGKNVQMKL